MGDLVNPTTMPVGIAASNYAQNKKALVGLVNQIRSGGAQLDIDLPRIAVIGKQSAGKSSLIEAISAVSLRFETDQHGQPLPKVREIPFGPPLSNADTVEATLRRAQLAILNPSVGNPVKFVELDFEEVEEGVLLFGSEEQLQFSSNVVCVDISGPEVTDLAFVDLPGMVANAEQATIDLVKNLVIKYIKGNCLILVALTIGDDIENQSAAHLAKQEDPEGKRTIGVLTKPDLLPPGEEDTWLQILRNEKQKHKLLHGYFCTKQPNADALRKNPSFSESRHLEEAFFRQGIWGNLPSDIRNRLGTAKLTAALSDRLSHFIADKLPSLIAEVNELWASVVNEIRGLPSPPSQDAAFELLNLCVAFTSEISEYSRASPDHLTLVQEARKTYEQFKHHIQATVPELIPFETGREGGEDYKEPEFLSDGIELPTGSENASARLRLDLDGTRHVIKSVLGRELPHNVPYEAKRQLILKSTASWSALSFDCLDQIRPLVIATVDKLINKYFGRFGSGLRGVVTTLVADEIERLVATAREHLEWLTSLDDEPFTQNSHYLSDTRVKIFSHFQELRRDFDPSKLGEDTKTNIASALGAAGLPTEQSNLARLFPNDVYETELDVMAYVRAFFQIAFKRIVDDTPRAIDRDVIRPLSSKILERLVQGLGLHGDGGADTARRMLAESPEIAAKREDLNKRKERLDTAKAALRTWGIGVSA
ncbi:hypothetical protein MNV49_002235 [Pseudohyphozyma bogoriensis]|nr:hypothetical protein MNV49_002235 [Pseudohyphozyma bogoriensis]